MTTASGDIVYQNGGVIVTVWPQKNGKKLKAVEKPMPPAADMKGGDRFSPKRLVKNIAIVEEQSPETYLSQFDPPIKIEVEYTPVDLPEQSGKTLKLAYWDGSSWVVFDETIHRFRLLPADARGRTTGEVYISQWAGDPPIGWGGYPRASLPHLHCRQDRAMQVPVIHAII
jgi:hypothetical protein